MCLIAFALNAHPQWPLLLLANRDEFHDRTALPSQWWHAETRLEGGQSTRHPPVFGGRDLKAGGSWMAISPMRRLTALTNIRQPLAPAGERSRGELVLGALNVADLAHLDLSPYASFNLLHASPVDIGMPGGRWQMQYANSMGELTQLPDGVHGLSNAVLNTPWPKTRQLSQKLTGLLHKTRDSASVNHAAYLSGSIDDFFSNAFQLLEDRSTWPDDALPSTGVPLEWERMLSATCIVSPAYGTRCSTVVAVDAGGQVHWQERTRDIAGQVVGEVRTVLFGN